MHTKTLVEIANTLPSTPRELAAIKGFGKNKTQKYGVEVLEIVGRRRK